MLSDRDMRQLVTDATHNKCHILDVIIVQNNTAMITSRPSVYDPCLCDTHGNISCDHMAIMFRVNATKPAQMRKEVVFRRLHHICLQEFKRDIAFLHDEINSAAPVGDIVAAYNDGLRCVVDNHAPQRTVTVTLRPDCPRGILMSSGTRNSVDGELSANGCKPVLRYIGRRIVLNTIW